jgi:hypothetical protein
MARKQIDVNTAIFFAEAKIKEKLQRGESIPRFSRKYETIVDYLKSSEFAKTKPEYQRRVKNQAMEHPQWTLAEARGHSKKYDPKTAPRWQIFDKEGKYPEYVSFLNRKEETKYSEYMTALRIYQDTGDSSKLEEWKKSWGKGSNTFKLIDGREIKAVKDLKTLNRLIEHDEIPTGPDIYQK